MVLLVAVTAVFSAVALGASRVALCTTGDGDHCYGWAAHPARLVFGADGRLEFLKLKWSGWGKAKTSATGVRRDDGGPAGHPQYIYHRVTMTASRIGYCGAHRAYTRLVIRSPGLPNDVENACHPG